MAVEAYAKEKRFETALTTTSSLPTNPTTQAVIHSGQEQENLPLSGHLLCPWQGQSLHQVVTEACWKGLEKPL